MDLFQTPYLTILPPASWKIIMPSSSFHIEPSAIVDIVQISLFLSSAESVARTKKLRVVLLL
jgi:hypothetical protein